MEMVEKSELTQEFVQSCKKKFGERLKCILLFGSRARGTASEHSDWDFLVVAEGLPEKTSERHKEFIQIKRKIIRRFEDVISVTPLTPSELMEGNLGSLLYGVLTGYEVLHDEKFWNRYLESVKSQIKRRNPVYVEEDKEWKIRELM